VTLYGVVFPEAPSLAQTSCVRVVLYEIWRGMVPVLQVLTHNAKMKMAMLPL
jgi:hypothetical protein